MSSHRQSQQKNMDETAEINYLNVRNYLETLEKQYNCINEEITTNLKVYDVYVYLNQEIVAEDKETYSKIKRNLEDIKVIFVNDLDKFEQTVHKSIEYNEALYNRLEKDAHYLRDDQETLRKKMIQMDKRINEMNEQIGNGF